MIHSQTRILLTSLWLLLSMTLSASEYPWLDSSGHGSDPSQSRIQRIEVPEGYRRVEAENGSFAYWLRHLPLKAAGSPVVLYNGKLKSNQNAHYAVIDLDVGKTDLQQCADAVIRLRAEYLFSQNKIDCIQFCFTSGDRIPFSRWVKGERPKVDGNRVRWIQTEKRGASYSSFKDYLKILFTYAGTSSLSRELMPVQDISQMKIGDVFIQGGFPGHAVIVVDRAENPSEGKTVFLLAQSYMPAQEMHILKNPNHPQVSPWYDLNFGESLYTPEWTFTRNDLKRFAE